MEEQKKKTSNKVILIVLGIILIVIAGAMVIAFTDPASQLAKIVSKEAPSDKIIDEAKSFLFEKEPVPGKDTQDLLTLAKNKLRTNPAVLNLVLVADAMKADGLDEQFAESFILSAVSNVDYLKVIEKNAYSSLEFALKKLSHADQMVELNRCLMSASNADTKGILNVFEFCAKDYQMDELVSFAQILDRYRISGDEFLINTLPDVAKEEVISRVSLMPKDVQKRIILCYASDSEIGMDVLFYIKEAKKLGILPSELYPEGVVVSMDLTGANKRAALQNLEGNKYIVVRRTEKEEPCKSVAASQFEMPNSYSSLYFGNQGKFDANFDENDKSDPATFTVRIETKYMDKMKEDNMPSSIEECDFIVLSDSTYMCGGTLFRESSFSAVTGYSYSPIYVCVQDVCVITPPDWNKVYFYASNITEPPAPPENMSNTSLAFMVLDPKKYNIILPDEEWSDQMLSEFVQKINAEGPFFAK